MASAPSEPPILHRESPSPEATPAPALDAYPSLSRCLSSASSASHGSATTDASGFRESLGSNFSAASRQSSASFQSSRPSDAFSYASSRQSTGSIDGSGKPSLRRRGYMRPQGTDFAASARSRESVLSLGSITHLQYYFARTGLLDGKGGQVARKRQQKGQTLDLSSLDTSSLLAPRPAASDVDSSYASMGSSPELTAHSFVGPVAEPIVESPIEEHPHGEARDEEYFFDDFDEPDPNVLPPTTSTYNFREKPLARPPSVVELKADLSGALDSAAKALDEVRVTIEPARLVESAPTPAPTDGAITATPSEPAITSQPSLAQSPGWYEIQGMHILDVMTLAIRAAKVYYTAHEQPGRLDTIKSEKELRSELLAVMDVLKRMATRGFAGGMRDDELRIMDSWVTGVYDVLRREDDLEAAERAERAGWAWMQPDSWSGREVEREEAFLHSLLDSADPAANTSSVVNAPLPKWVPIDRTAPLETQTLPTPFLQSLQNGLRLVHLHNAAVRKSRRRFGTIPTFHTDTQKPYRCADNLRYWVKAAELRWEVLLRVDALAVACNSSPQAWLDFEDAILKWCRRVREEISSEVHS